MNNDKRLVTHYSLLIILSAFVALSLLHSLATPLFEGPDEIWHYAFADHLASGGGLPVFDANQPATLLRNGAHPPLYYLIVSAVIAPIDRSDFPAQFHFNLASPKITPGGQSDKPNLFVHTAYEDFPYQTTTLAAHLARLISIALGAITIAGVWKVAHRLLPDTCGGTSRRDFTVRDKARSACRRDRLAIAATALVAFIPQFVYGSATINNDALAAASATWLIYALIRLKDDLSIRWSLISGMMLGVTLLSKIGMIAVLPVPVLALALSNHQVTETQTNQKNFRDLVSLWLKSLHWKRLFVSGSIIYIFALTVAGWWYIRNWTLYGDPLAWKQWAALTGVGRMPPTIGDFVHDMIGLFGTFWADFSLRVDRTWVWVFGALVLIAIVGLVRRAFRREWPSMDWGGLIIALVWLGLLLASAVRYSFSIYDIHGRLLYPALSAIGVALALGLSGWNEIVERRLIWGTIGGLVLLNAIVPFGVIAPAYAPPIVSALPNLAIKTDEVLGDVRLIGYQVENAQVKSGETATIATYWRRVSASTATSPIYGILSLVDHSGRAMDHLDLPLGTDIYPSWAWRSNDIVATSFTFPISTAESTLVRFQVSVRGVDRSLEVGQVVVRNDRPCHVDRAADVTFGGSIKLIGYRLEQSATVGEPSRVILCWQSIKLTPIDYTVFVHVIDRDDRLITEDAQPRDGEYPTSAWSIGEQIEDSHPLPAVIGLVIKRVSIGLYRLDTGERLTIDRTNETEFVLPTP